MTKIFWTVVILSPIFLVGLAQIVGIDSSNDLGAFNASGAFDKWKYFFKQIGDDIDVSGTYSFWAILLTFITAIFLTMPFIFVWKGTRIVSWIPIMGFVIRIIILLILIFMPGLDLFWNIFSMSDEQIKNVQGWFEVIILTFAIIGIWFIK